MQAETLNYDPTPAWEARHQTSFPFPCPFHPTKSAPRNRDFAGTSGFAGEMARQGRRGDGGRAGRIRTAGLLLPKQARCLATLPPAGSYLSGSAGRVSPAGASRVGFMTQVPDQLSPDLTVLDTGGQTVRLRDLAAGKALVIVFIRHFG
jgi:hypothetical protein